MGAWMAKGCPSIPVLSHPPFHLSAFYPMRKTSPVLIPFQYVASVWELKNQIVKRSQKNFCLVQIVAVVDTHPV
jgi:hypothetical protein